MFKLKGGEKDDDVRPYDTPVFLIENGLVVIACRLREMIDTPSIKLDEIESG